MKIFLAAITLLYAVGCENQSSELSDARSFEAAAIALESEDQNNQEIEENQESALIDQEASSIDTSVQETKKDDTDDSENIIIASDISPPIINSVKINEGITYTTSQEVLLDLDVIDAAEMYLTNSPNCTSGGEWESFSGTKEKWKIKDLNSKSTIYAKFRDLSSNETECLSFSILHDNIPPITTIKDKPSNPDNSSSPNFSFTCSEECTFQVRVDEENWFNVKNPHKLSGLKSGEKKLEVRSIDAAGNIETNPAVYNWTIDQTPPDSPSISISSGNEFTSSSFTSLSLSANSADQMYITNFPGCNLGGEWKTFSNTEASWVLAQTNEEASVYVKFRDLAGNESSCASDTIIHDNTSPTNIENLDDGTFTSYKNKSPSLSWSASSDIGGSGIDYYEVKVGTSLGGDDIHSSENVGNVTNYTIDSLENSFSKGIQYYVSVRSVDLAGNTSEWVSGDGFSLLIPFGHEQAKVLASDAQANDLFGTSVSLSGDYAIVGAQLEDTEVRNVGAAYIFKTSDNGESWVQKAKIQASDKQADDYFGFSVSISGNYAIMGASHEDDSEALYGNNAGAAYIFKTSDNGETWVQQAKIQALDKQADDLFGFSVAISGEYAIIGAVGEDTGRNGAGAAYIFKTSDNGETWTQKAKVQASDRQQDDSFGYSVSISGDFAIIGAKDEDTGGNNAGAAYILKTSDSGETWTQKAKIQASDKQAGDYFGTSVSISGGYAIIGAIENTGGTDAGAAYIFKTSDSGETWTQKAKIQASDKQAGDYFGTSVSISGGYAIIGAKWEDTGEHGAGAAYIFKTSDNGETWVEIDKVQASDKGKNAEFGSSVSISGDYAIIGAALEGSAGTNAGAAYIFK